MQVTLLGTGAAAGWPHPFCTCASCAAAAIAGEIRAHTSALVDGVLLVDCGQDVPRSAVRLGVPLDGVRHLLVTHDHHDHANGAALLWRRWADPREPLDVVGPASALAVLAQWLPPDDPGVHFVTVEAGDQMRLGDYTVLAIAADHHSPGALIYDIADADVRMLYATDTGPGFELPAGVRYDLVLLEETWGDRQLETAQSATGHHDLAAFAATIAGLRRIGAVDAGTRLVAVHLGHGNPAPAELRTRLAVWGAELLPDGALIDLDGAVAAARTVAPRRPHRTLVLGGARSGKSTTAERLLAAEPAVRYVATSSTQLDDPEWQDRIATHRARRPASWSTLENADLAAVLGAPSGTPVLIDCATLWLARVMADAGVWTAADEVAAKAADEAVAQAIDDLVSAWRTTTATVVAVSNEVGAGIVPDHPSGRRFRDELGSLNARLAAESDEVLLVTAGIARSLVTDATEPS